MKAYLFDVDGVLSHNVHKKVTEPELFDQIIKKLQNGNPVCLNTGRSITLMSEIFINSLLEYIQDKAILQKFMAIGEKGGTWITFNAEGSTKYGKISDVKIPEEVKKEAKKLVNEKYHEAMFFDDTKETMMSIEMNKGFDIDLYHTKQSKFLSDLRQIVAKYNLEETFKIDPTTIAVDVESQSVGKNLGAARFLSFLKDINCEPSEFITFGDSESDFGMSDELEKRGKKVKMIYVGDKDKLGEIQRNYPIEYIGGFTQGTLAYLKEHQE